jgi:hypothetical protein
MSVNLCARGLFIAHRRPAIGHARGGASSMISELPLNCPRCNQTTLKPVEWVQQNTFFTCAHCGTAVLIDKDLAAQLLAQLELQQRR